MKYVKTDFLSNYKELLNRNDVEGLRDLFNTQIADLVANRKTELIANLNRSLGANIKTTITNSELVNYLIEGLFAKNKKVMEVLVGMIITSESGPKYLNVEGEADKKAPKGKKEKPVREKMSGDQIGELVGTVAKGLGGVMEFAKSFNDVKVAKEQAKVSLMDQVKNNTQTQPTYPEQAASSGMSGGKIAIIVGGVILVSAIIGGVIFMSRKKAASGGSGAPAPAAVTTAGGAA